MHGLASPWLGLRTRSLGKGGSRGLETARVMAWGLFLPATILAEYVLCAQCRGRLQRWDRWNMRGRPARA